MIDSSTSHDGDIAVGKRTRFIEPHYAFEAPQRSISRYLHNRNTCCPASILLYEACCRSAMNHGTHPYQKSAASAADEYEGNELMALTNSELIDLDLELVGDAASFLLMTEASLAKGSKDGLYAQLCELFVSTLSSIEVKPRE